MFPVIVTVAPTVPLAGDMAAICGGNTKSVALDTVVQNVTSIGPVVAPVGTEVVMLVDVLAVTTAGVPLNSTMLFAGVVLKFVPVIVTVVPGPPNDGVKLTNDNGAIMF